MDVVAAPSPFNRPERALRRVVAGMDIAFGHRDPEMLGDPRQRPDITACLTESGQEV
jgi:hypothetical protein